MIEHSGEIVDAMKKRKTLRLTNLINRFHQKQFECDYNFIDEFKDCANYNDIERENYNDYDDDYLKIFIASHQEQNCDVYIFTSCFMTESFREIDKHISLEIHWQNTTKKGLSKLFIKRWLNRLCFLDGYCRRKVIFF